MGLPYINYECHLISTVIVEVTYLDRKFSVDQTLYVVTKLAGVQIKPLSLLSSKTKRFLLSVKNFYMSLNNMCYLSKALLPFFSKLQQSQEVVNIP